jgi:hypothetical protein
MKPFFLWTTQYNKVAVEKRTFGSVGETADVMAYSRLWYIFHIGLRGV